MGGVMTLHDLAVARERLELPADATTRYAEEIKPMSAGMIMTEIICFRWDVMAIEFSPAIIVQLLLSMECGALI